MKVGNQYASAFGRMYAITPKSVFAAVAFSFASWACGDEATDNTETIQRFIDEWRTLCDNGIVPQWPPKSAPDMREGN